MKLITICTLSVGLGLSAIAGAKNLRKVDKNQVGNCVFSAAMLAKGHEDEYKLASSFKPGDELHARCYFGKTVKDYARDGKMKNSLRAPIEATIAAQAEGPAWYATITWSDDKSKWWHRTRIIYIESETGHWDQQRFSLIPGGTKNDCDWMQTKFNKPDDCVNLEEETINLGHNLNKTGKYTAEVCIDVFYRKVDKTRLGDDLKQVDVVVDPDMARGCFNYTVDL